MGWKVICVEHYFFSLHLGIRLKYHHRGRQTGPRCCCGYYWTHRTYFSVSHVPCPACSLKFCSIVSWCMVTLLCLGTSSVSLQKDCRNESHIKTIVTFSLLCTWACTAPPRPKRNKNIFFFLKKVLVDFCSEETFIV